MMEILDILLPIIVFAASSLLTIFVHRFSMRMKKGSYILNLIWFLGVFVAAIFSVANLTLKYYSNSPSHPILRITLVPENFAIFSSAFLVDSVSVYMAIMFAAVAIIVILYSLSYIRQEDRTAGRYYATMLMITGCVIGTAFAGDFLTLFIFWEITAACSAFLMLYNKTAGSVHATLKYLVMIIIASAFIIYALSIIYSLSGTLNFWAVKQALMTLKDKHLLEIAFLFMAAGYSIEAAVVPFHMWLPDAYTMAPASSSAFLSALVDQASYYVLLRVLLYILTPPTVLPWTLMFAALSALTMIVGNLLALAENNVKRLISYVCIADVGYNLVAITSATELGIMGNLYFFLIGGITTALAFMIIGILNNMGLRTLEDFSGIGRRMPLTSLTLMLAAFSFAGVPPLAGFIAKYMIFTSAIEGNLGWLAVIGVLTSVVQTAYLLRLINYMYAKKPKVEAKIKEPVKLLIPVLTLTAAIIILGLYPTIVLNLIAPIVQELPLIP
ncbi:NADH-quinone oxidoreductase subunit N [Candidatus Bathyarchaeota archaeon]|nr:NADH-quinone oxidoreductase subunit N [Candidatus Bathyarchaeota archaeon]